MRAENVYGKPIVYERSPDEEFHTIANMTQNYIEEDEVISEQKEKETLQLEATESAPIGESTFVKDIDNTFEERPLISQETLGKYALNS